MDDSDTSSCSNLMAHAEYNGPSSPSPSEVMVVGINTSQSTLEDASIENQINHHIGAQTTVETYWTEKKRKHNKLQSED